MKHNTHSRAIPLYIAIALYGGMASAYIIKDFRQANPVEINLPASPDSTSKENAFKKELLLDSRLPVSLREQTADWTTVTTDSNGVLRLVQPRNAAQLQTFTTRIRTPRFSKGELKLYSTGMANILVDGKSVAKKTSEDSVLTESSSKISLNPEQDYEIQINTVSFPSDSISYELKLEYIPQKDFEDIAPVTNALTSRRFSTKLTMTGNRIAKVAMSPDGKYLLLKYVERFSEKEKTYNSTIMETATGKIIAENLNYYLKWMPKGSTLYSTKETNGGYTLTSMELPTLRTKVIAEGLPSDKFTFLPDMQSIVYYKTIEGKKDEGDLRRVLEPDDRIPGNRQRSYIMVYNLSTHTSSPITYGGNTTSILDIDYSGKKLLYSSTEMRPDEFPFYFTSLIEVDLGTLKTDTIIANDGYLSNAIYSPDATKLFITGSPSAFGGIGKNCGNHEIANDYDTQGFIYNLRTKSVISVTKDFDPAVEGQPVWNSTDNQIYFRGEEGFFRNLYCLNPETLIIKKIGPDNQNITGFTIGDEQSKWLAYYSGNFTNIGQAYLLNLKTQKDILIANPMESELAGVKFGEMIPWSFTASDGTKIDGYECLPPEFDPNKKYPLIVYYYGGTSPSSSGIGSPYSPQVFASRNYVVYVLNPSGTTGYGQEFSARHVNAWGKRTAEDIIEGVKEFCKEHPYVNEKKIGCIGASYGGFMTEYLQTQTDIFAAAVSHAGISNVTSYWGEGYWGYSYNAIAAAKSYPWNNPDLFTKQGALFNADKIHTPLLLLHGSEDTNVPIGESIQLFNALRILGRDVEFITVEGENHIITNFDKKILWQNTIMAWFAKYLQDDPRWWDELYGNN